ncbi:MAG: branched chain amino acid aminotransferase [Ignavibacteriae bacterium HGW-Ignavibacteriae-3]|nr:MAG: branched chain amino acid aminotransferase [Ignavibacteriae bacterium HGW-Ignavibacteriae-3]
MAELTYEVLDRENKIVLPENLIFGKIYSDHVFEMDFDAEKGGWYNPTIKKFGNIQLSPAAMVLHYGQTIFEGLKAYKQDNGRVALFRPEKNIERLNRSAKRMCIPEVDPEFVLQSLLELVRVDKDWIPTRPGHSLYIRPVMFATEPLLGVRSSYNFKLIIMLSPVGPYYPEGFRPVPIYATDKYARAVRKGIGEAKTAGNYAASLMGQQEAKKEGYSQVLWLDAIEQKYIEEVGAMNIFVRFKDEVTTPMLTGSILPGITRMSVLQILKDWKYNTTERMISLQEIIDSYKAGELIEIFGTGTAAVISSVSKLKYRDDILLFSETEAGELGTKLYKELAGIQYGRVEDKHNWLTYID